VDLEQLNLLLLVVAVEEDILKMVTPVEVVEEVVPVV
tara:strand:- start:500 stop:610 length:111 start_codon:yes stop_codon:yes gene_type:complete